MSRFDHLKLVRRDLGEVARFSSWLRSATPGELCEVQVLHEHDGRCCRQEPWPTTYRTLSAGTHRSDLVLFDLPDDEHNLFQRDEGEG
jgi:hypothetical protein